ncbi:MAG: O-antigen ligase family protein [Clostridiales bacterium]|jgi:hypothetical protein|nr:O-antigen ligase family protein [Clostridiales bacterium]
MQTGSFVIRKATAFLLWLNYFFEYSLIYKGLQAIANASKSSRIANEFLQTERDYWQGSFILRFFSFIVGGIFSCVGWIFIKLKKLNENSLNRKIVLYLAGILRQARNDGFWSRTFFECVPVRLAIWFFDLKKVYMLFIAVTLVVPSTMWNNRYLFLSAVFFAGIYALKWFLTDSENIKPKFSQLSPALLLFVFFCAFSIITGYGGADSLRVFIIFFACVIHSVLVVLIFNKLEDFKLFFIFIAAALVIAALFGFYQFAAGIEIRAELVDLSSNPGLSRLYSSMGNPNNDAQVWAMFLPFLIAACITVKCDIKRLTLAGVILLVLAAFAMTYSRAGYIAFIAGMGVFVLLAAPRLIPVALLALIFALPFVPAGIIERMLTLGSDTSSSYRFLIWGGVLNMLEDFWVRGIGMGPDAFIRIYRGYAHPLAERAMHSHNMFFDLVTHSGIGALLAFLAYLFGLLKRGVSAHVNSSDKEYKIFMSAGIAALTVFVALGIGEYVWFYPRVMLVFWIIAGLVCAMAKVEKT